MYDFSCRASFPQVLLFLINLMLSFILLVINTVFSFRALGGSVSFKIEIFHKLICTNPILYNSIRILIKIGIIL